MSQPGRFDPPRPSRYGPGWARRINDGTVEWLAAWARIWSLTWLLVTIGSAYGLVWWPSWDWSLTLALSSVVTAAHVWVGFVWLANPEWRKDAPE